MKKSPFCAEEIQGGTTVRKHCSRDLASPVTPSTAPAKQKTGCSVGIVLTIVGLCALAGLNAGCLGQREPVTSLEDKGRAQYEPRLAEIMQKEQVCWVSRTFYMGWNARTETLFWSVECSAGRQFMISVEAKTGVTKTMSCDRAEVVGIRCFERLK